jgi:hypothetical protein
VKKFYEKSSPVMMMVAYDFGGWRGTGRNELGLVGTMVEAAQCSRWSRWEGAKVQHALIYVLPWPVSPTGGVISVGPANQRT